MSESEHRTPTGDRPPVELSKQPADSPDEPPFDPYRYGAPDVPPPPEYAPPGYVPPTPAPGQYAGGPYAGGPYSGGPYTGNPYAGGPHGGGQYPPPPYPGTPPYPQPPGGPGAPVKGGNGRAVTGLVLGIVSIVLCFTSLLDAVLVVLAVVFSALGLSESRRTHVGRGQAIAGLVCAAVGAVLAVGITVLIVHISKACSGYSSGSSAYEQCVRDHL